MTTKRTERPSDTEWLGLDIDLRVAAAAAVLWEIRDHLEDIAKSQRILADRATAVDFRPPDPANNTAL